VIVGGTYHSIRQCALIPINARTRRTSGDNIVHAAFAAMIVHTAARLIRARRDDGDQGRKGK
jgi:hypothetical protein